METPIFREIDTYEISHPTLIQKTVKRCFDIFASAFGLVILLPVFIIIALAIYIDSKSPVIFKQTRVGKDGKEFIIYKFRSMKVISAENNDVSNNYLTLEIDPRVTKVGKFIRKYRLDELPQLVNVLIGDMSIVGPRPEVPYYVHYYTERQKKTLSVRPGLTGTATILFLNEDKILSQSLDPEKTYIEDIMPAKIEQNLLYLKNFSLYNDFSIIFLTIKKLIFRF
ncbi:MAG: sugar transferase [Bacillota bacterium]|nr:sugar transferase [Bacillota bacterium]